MDDESKGIYSMSTKTNLVDVLQATFDYNIANIHTALPGTVKNYDASTGTCEVQIDMKRKLRSGTILEYPAITGVPVIFPSGQKGGFTWEVSSGDQVLLVFSERSLDKWTGGGSSDTPNSGRKFDFNDAIAIPCVFPTTKRKSSPALRLQKTGTIISGKKIFIGDPTGPKVVGTKPMNPDLIDLVLNLANLVKSGLFEGTLLAPPGVAGGPVSAGPILAPLATDISAIIQALTQMKLEVK